VWGFGCGALMPCWWGGGFAARGMVGWQWRWWWWTEVLSWRARKGRVRRLSVLTDVVALSYLWDV
jgi:hypothetical protein